MKPECFMIKLLYCVLAGSLCRQLAASQLLLLLLQ